MRAEGGPENFVCVCPKTRSTMSRSDITECLILRLTSSQICASRLSKTSFSSSAASRPPLPAPVAHSIFTCTSCQCPGLVSGGSRLIPAASAERKAERPRTEAPSISPTPSRTRSSNSLQSRWDFWMSYQEMLAMSNTNDSSHSRSSAGAGGAATSVPTYSTTGGCVWSDLLRLIADRTHSCSPSTMHWACPLTALAIVAASCRRTATLV
mmetsp:Transcript_32953/g.93723  ORF Transcript_32953/g.93723 Transcript_32953/m.93723 type:complete len:210 (+) Transcript_32953:149-778(+)